MNMFASLGFLCALAAASVFSAPAEARPFSRTVIKDSSQSETSPVVSSGSVRDEGAGVGGAGVSVGRGGGAARQSSLGGGSGSGGSSGGGSRGGSGSSGGGQKSPGTTGVVTHKGQVVLSATYNGAARNSFTTAQVIYGKVTGLGQSAVYSCAAPRGSSFCDNRNEWTKLPNEDWTYSAADKTWRMATVFNQIPAGVYKMAFEDRASGADTAFVEMELTAPQQPAGCRWSSPDPVIGPCSGPYVNGHLLACSASNSGQVLNTSGGSESCGARWTCNCY